MAAPRPENITGKYPPSEFCRKYSTILAPEGKLLKPSEVFGKNGRLSGSSDAEDKTKQAFRITLKKLKKLNTPSEKLREELKIERMDQIIECFPNSISKDLPEVLRRVKWSVDAKEVDSWERWWQIHQPVTKLLQQQAQQIHSWWDFVGVDDPGQEAIVETLKRLVSGVVTHPLTIGKILSEHSTTRKKNAPKSIHLVGTDCPEATMIYAGFYHEILAANPQHTIKLALISPDPANKQMAQDCAPESPKVIHPRCKLTAWDGLYHDYWNRFVATGKVDEPDMVMGIHPGLHANGIYEFWEPTLLLLLDKDVLSAFTFYNEEEFTMSLDRLDRLFASYVFKGRNPFASRHVKQTLHNRDLTWSSNQYLIIFKGRTVDLKTLTLAS